MHAWLQRMDRHFPVRYTGLAGQRGAAACWPRSAGWPSASAAAALVCLFLTGLGWRDTRQRRHSVLRNYPVIGHLRFLLEFVRPRSASTSSRATRGRAVLAPAAQHGLPARQGRARQAALRHPARRAGRRLRVDQPLAGADRAASHDFRVTIGGGGTSGTQPYSASVFNISAMSFGSLSAQRHPGAQRRREEGRLRARHRRGLDQPAPPRARRRPDLGDRLGLLRLPQRRRQLQPERFAANAPTRRSS
jgi:hypothetical protein